MTSREGFDAYCLYLAINNHFNTESYDFFKYNGKVPVKLPAFLKRNDKYHFAKLAREHRDELRDFLVANLSKEKYYVKNLLDKIVSCAILSNYDNDHEPTIHIRFEFSKFNINYLIDLKDIILYKLKFRGVDNIKESNIIETPILQFDDDNKYITQVKKEYKIKTLGINLNEIYHSIIPIFYYITNDMDL